MDSLYKKTPTFYLKRYDIILYLNYKFELIYNFIT